MAFETKRECIFPSIEYDALNKILDEVGLRVTGAGHQTDRLRLVIKDPIEDRDGGLRLILSYYDIQLLLAICEIAVGVNRLDDCTSVTECPGEGRTDKDYDRLNAAEAVVISLREFLGFDE